MSENPQRGLRENNNKKLTQKFASIYAETSTFWQWRFFSAHRRAADSAICLAVAIFILELVAPSLERASGMVAVLESKTHGSDCLIVAITLITERGSFTQKPKAGRADVKVSTWPWGP